MYKMLNLDLYKLNEQETLDYIKEKLVELSIPFKEYNGNIWGIRHKNHPCFCAHTDTVHDADMTKKLTYDGRLNILGRENGILGADDKAGINILLNNIEDINFAFFVKEEAGGIGSTEMSYHKEFLNDLTKFYVPFFVAYDRRGRRDMISVDNLYCGDDLATVIEEVTHYRRAEGIYCDIDNLRDILPGVNLSCGYNMEHSDNEYLDVRDWLKCSESLQHINRIRGIFIIPERPTFDWQNYIDMGGF